MYCSNCRAELEEGATFCANCGTWQHPVVSDRDATQQQAYPAQNLYDPQHTFYAAPGPVDAQQNYSLKWFRFMVNFALFFGALITIGSAGMTFTGLQYARQGVDAALLYASFPALKAVDMAYGALLVVDAALIVLTRFQLAGFKKNGPTLLYAVTVVGLVMSVGYTFIVAAVLNGDLTDATVLAELVGQIIGTLVVLVLNIIYYSKRKALFCR